MKRKRLYVIFSGLVLIMVVAVLFRLSVPFDRGNSPSAARLEKDRSLYQKALENGNSFLCTEIGDSQSQAFCQQDMALRNSDQEICEEIADMEIREQCQGQVALSLALSNQSLSSCMDINDRMLRKYCLESLAGREDIPYCRDIQDQMLREACLSSAYYNQAKVLGESSFCSDIPQLVRRANCLSEISGIDLHSDSDGDGLDFLQEITAGTDANDSDTDHDGYGDGEEKGGGFNPTGEGEAAPRVLTYGEFCGQIPAGNLRAACQLQFAGDRLNKLVDCSGIMDRDIRIYCETAIN